MMQVSNDRNTGKLKLSSRLLDHLISFSNLSKFTLGGTIYFSNNFEFNNNIFFAGELSFIDEIYSTISSSSILLSLNSLLSRNFFKSFFLYKSTSTVCILGTFLLSQKTGFPPFRFRFIPSERLRRGYNPLCEKIFINGVRTHH